MQETEYWQKQRRYWKTGFWATDNGKFLIALTLIGGFVVLPIVASCTLAARTPTPTQPAIATNFDSNGTLGPPPPKAVPVTPRVTHPTVVAATVRHPRRRHHHAARPVAPVDPLAFEPTLHLLKWGHFVTDEIGFAHVTGTAINNTGADLAYAQVTIRLLDRSGTQVGSVMGNTVNLPAGARWRFEATGNGEGASRCEGAEFSGN